ncbi:MAG: hypothetical protein ACRDUV_25750 [Pseudonocardiaceae bacterium]
MASAVGFDEIVVLDRGNAVERGTPVQLLASRGLYAGLRIASAPRGAAQADPR